VLLATSPTGHDQALIALDEPGDVEGAACFFRATRAVGVPGGG